MAGGYESQRSSLSSIEHPLSLIYMHLQTHSENHLYKHKQQDKQGLKTEAGQQPGAVFSHSTHKHMHINTHEDMRWHARTHTRAHTHTRTHTDTHTHSHSHTHTTSNYRRLIEVSATVIVFVHLGMKEPFWPVSRRHQCGTAQAGAQLGYVCLRLSGRGAAKCGCTSLPHSSTHQLPLNKYTQPTGSNNDIQPEREERTPFRKHLHAQKSAVG